MPHFGEQAAILGTLQRDGAAIRTDNALRADPAAITNYELREDGSIELREDGSRELRE